METNNKLYHLPLMLLAILTMIAAAWAGLIRLGWGWPALQPTLPINHGPLMVAGFFGTLISLERAVALGKRWTYLGPLMSGLGGILLAFGVNTIAGPVLLAMGSLWLVIIFAVVLKQHLTSYTVVMALGALALLVGNLLWLFGWPIYQFVLWWAGFLVLTIAGERLELSRMMPRTQFSIIAFVLTTVLYLAGMIVMLISWDLGVRVAGVGLIGLAIWLLRYDIARRTVKQDGLTRFIAVCLLSGYVWLLGSGGLSLIYGGVVAGPIYDAMLHGIFLGFVFAMVFGHAPIIFPAVLGLDIRYRSSFYIPLVLLHLSLLLRTAGELAGLSWARLWGGLINVVAVMIYFGMIVPIGKRSTPNP